MTDKMREEFEKCCAFVGRFYSDNSPDSYATYEDTHTELAYRAWQAATAQSEQEMEALRRKLAEQQAALFTVRTILAGDNDNLAQCAMDAIRHIDKHSKGKEELTRFEQEAEQRGAVKYKKDADRFAWVRANYVSHAHGGMFDATMYDLQGESIVDAIDAAMADELEGRKV